MSKRAAKATPDDDAPVEPSAETAHEATGPAAMAGKVIALRCRGCSALVPTDHAWNKAVDGMSAKCPTCHTVTVWRDYEVVDPPEPKPEGEDTGAKDAGEAGQPDAVEPPTKARGTVVPTPDVTVPDLSSDPDAEAMSVLLRGGTARDAGISATKARELRGRVKAMQAAASGTAGTPGEAAPHASTAPAARVNSAPQSAAVEPADAPTTDPDADTSAGPSDDTTTATD